jgi:hypothetical protein
MNEHFINFIKKSTEIHNNKYDYSLVNYSNNRTKIKIICPIHGIFKQTADKHSNRKHGCPSCGKTKKITKEYFLSKTNELYGDLFKYPNLSFDNCHDKIEIECTKHGSFYNKLHIHLKTNSCIGCRKERRFNEYKKQCEIIHNNKFDYTLTDFSITTNSVQITCTKHGLFEQLLHSHKSGIGCPKCSTSRGETSIINYLIKKEIIYFHQEVVTYLNKKHIFDFYLPNYNLFIEYDGEQHFKSIDYFGGDDEFKKIIHNDNLKNEYCKLNNINLLRIPYTEFKKIENILDDNLI